MSTGNHLLRIKFAGLLVLCGFILTPLLHGQYSDVDLSVYKLPDIKLNKLDVSFNFNSNLQNESIDNNGDKYKNHQAHTIGGLNLSFSRYVNSKRYQEDILINAQMQGYRQGTENETNLINTLRNDSYYNFSFSSSNRLYNNQTLFLEINPKFRTTPQYSAYTNKSDPENVSELKSRRYYSELAMPLSIGYGRIEPVQDLRLAIYILEELNKHGKIKELPSEEVLLEMAREISKVKRERFFDSRLRLMRELEVMDAFLASRGIIASKDIGYFNILNDQWNYGSGPVRESGFYVKAGLDNKMSRLCDYTDINNVQTPDDEKYKENISSFGPFVRSRYENPINLYWQSSNDVTVGYRQYYYRYPNNENSDYEQNLIYAEASASLIYLPNTRTSVALGITGYWEKYQNEYSNSTNESVTCALSPVVLDINYYVSPRLRVVWSSVYGYNYNSTHYSSTDTDIKRNRMLLNTMFIITYSIF